MASSLGVNAALARAT